MQIYWQLIRLSSRQRWSLVYRVESLLRIRIRLRVACLTLAKDGVTVALSNVGIFWFFVLSRRRNISMRPRKLFLLILRMSGWQIRKLWCGRCLSGQRFSVWNLSALTLPWLCLRLAAFFKLKLPTLVLNRHLVLTKLVSMRVWKIWRLRHLDICSILWTFGPIRPWLLSHWLVVHWISASELDRI